MEDATVPECMYPVYVSTYRAVADAMRRDDVPGLHRALLAASFLSGPAAVAAATAQLEAANRVPMRARAHFCRQAAWPLCGFDCLEVGRASA